MPAFRIPHQSGAHRTAAIALYRALLSQCRRLPSDATKRDELQNIIRNRFRQARHDDSTRRLKYSFEAGYEAIDHVDAAVAGDESSQRYISKLLETASTRLKQAPQDRHRQTLVKHEPWHANTVAVDPTPRLSILDRPLPWDQLSGKRHVPYMVSANQIPMLRIKKPQPQHLSGFLSHRIKQRQARYDHRARLLNELELAEKEDKWDKLVGESSGKSVEEAMLGVSAESEEPLWKDAIIDSIDELHRLLNLEKEKNREMATKMQGIIDRETELVEEDKAESNAREGVPDVVDIAVDEQTRPPTLPLRLDEP